MRSNRQTAQGSDFATFVWLVTDDILAEYREILERLSVRSAARIVALIRRRQVLLRTN